MYQVYWIELIRIPGQTELAKTPLNKEFDGTKLTEVIAFAESLRLRQRTGDPATESAVSFVTYCSENPNSVGHPGVSDPPSSYDWQKRRKNMPAFRPKK
ncbi:hypothetical protein ACO0LO_26755 [Undibacterium sp. TJN25]|uniref:hypothetical protein n=1 Tax=Undibacterium sp. TJN25 TaxID=3413056 RepID=UPI003BF01047